MGGGPRVGGGWEVLSLSTLLYLVEFVHVNVMTTPKK